jgi:hypothetical protein
MKGLVALIFSVSTVVANPVALGLRSGLSISTSQFNLSGGWDWDLDYRIGFNGDLLGECHLNRYASQQLSAGYYQSGFADKAISAYDSVDNFLGYGDWDFSLHYLKIGYSMLGHMPVGILIPYAFIGANFGFLVGMEDIFHIGNENWQMDNFAFEDLTRFSLSPIAGAGIRVAIGKLEAIGEYSFSYGLIPFYKRTESGETVARHHTYGHFINLGFVFFVKGHRE